MGFGFATRCALLCALIALVPVGGARAEVAAESDDGSTFVLVVGIIEDPDPISQSLWRQVRSGVDPETLLNPSGATRDDGPPAFAFAQATGWPLAVWAFSAGTDHDVALARWTGTRWAPARFLTVGSADELDPRVAIDPAGATNVVWWADGVVLHAVSPASTPDFFGEARQVSRAGETARRPSVAIHGGVPLVSYERDGGAGQQIVVASPAAGGTHVYDVVATTARTERLDAVLHSSNGRLWIDWRQSETALAWSERVNGAWTAPATVPVTGDGWFGIEDARDAVREQLIGF
jgi:hypothetical protein